MIYIKPLTLEVFKDSSRSSVRARTLIPTGYTRGTNTLTMLLAFWWNSWALELPLNWGLDPTNCNSPGFSITRLCIPLKNQLRIFRVLPLVLARTPQYV